MARLGDICKFQSGGTPSKSNPDFFGGNIPWITTVALNGGTIGNEDAVEWITDIAIQKSAAKVVPQNSILVGTRVGIGKVAINSVPMSTSQDVIAMLDIDTAIWNKNFLCKFIQSKNDFLLSQARGATIKGIKIETLSNMKVPDIPINEQCRIATVMDKVGALIAKRQAQLDKLDLLVKARFVEMFGDPVRNNRGWDTDRLDDLCNGVGDGLHGTPEYDENGIYPFINGNNLIDGKIVITDATKKINEKEYKKLFIEISKNAILISINGTLGKLAFYNGESVALGKSACYCNLRDKISRRFIYGIMESDAFADFMEKASTKSTIKNVGLKAMREFKVIRPPLKLQNQYDAFVEHTDKSKMTIQQSLDKLETLKKALMQQYYG